MSSRHGVGSGIAQGIASLPGMSRRRCAKIFHKSCQRRHLFVEDIAIVIARDSENWGRVMDVWLVKLRVIVLGFALVVHYITQVIKEGWMSQRIRIMEISLHVLDDNLLWFW